MKTPPIKWVRTREREGVACPWYMGLAYRDFYRDVSVYYIVPVNFIISCWLRFWMYIRFSLSMDPWAEWVQRETKRAILRERERIKRIIEDKPFLSRDVYDLKYELLDEIMGPR